MRLRFFRAHDPGAVHRSRRAARTAFLLLAATGLLVAGCGGSSSGSASGGSTSHATLTWWSWVPNDPLAIKNFNKKYPGIKIQLRNVGASTTEYTKLRTVLDSGSGAPCVVQIEYQALPTFTGMKKLDNIGKYVSKDKSDFPAWVWGQVSRGSAVYAVPEDIGPMGLIYNPALLSKYHLAMPTTWATFASDAKKLHREAPGEYMIQGPTGASTASQLTSMFWQAGANPFHLEGNGTWQVAINTPTTRKILRYWVNLVKAGGVSSGNESSVTFNHNIGAARYVSYWGAAWEPLFLTPYVTKSHPQHFAVTWLPQWHAGQHTAANWGGSTNAVTDQCSDPKAAALFASYINTSKSGVNLDATPYVSSGKGGRGLFPAANIRTQVPAFNKNPPDFAAGTLKKFNSFVPHVNTNFQWSPWTQDFYTELGVEANDAAKGKISVGQALATTQNKIVTDAKQAGYNVTVKSS